MRAIVQVEYRIGMLTVREEILEFLGHPVVSVLGSQAARQLDLSDNDVGVILIGHGAPWGQSSCSGVLLAKHLFEAGDGAWEEGLAVFVHAEATRSTGRD